MLSAVTSAASVKIYHIKFKMNFENTDNKCISLQFKNQLYNYIFYSLCSCPANSGGVIGRATDLRFTGCGFEFWQGTIAGWLWASYLHLHASVTKQYNLVLANGRRSLWLGK